MSERSTGSGSLLALLLLALIPLATELPAVASVALVAALLWALVVYETRSYGESRRRDPSRRPDSWAQGDLPSAVP